ncbi:MAG: transglycosylase domain-containing protein [Solirubrobacterales bacterium]
MAPRLRLPGRRPRGGEQGDGSTSPPDPTPNGAGSKSNGSSASPAGRPPGATPPAERASRSRPRLKKLRFALVFMGLVLLAFVSWIFGIMMAVASDLPQLEDRAQFADAQNSVVNDINGKRIATLTNNEGRILINSGDIAPVIKEATVSIEDQRFYEHRGVDFQGIGRAVVQDVLHTGATQGASTITEQFVKNALQAQGSRTIFQKLREAALAYQLERHWDKDKIITQYLNEIYFGEGAYGIEEAAKTYFGWNHPGCGAPQNRCASQLLPWEAATLAGLIANPSGYDPRINPKDSEARRNQVLQNMANQGYITQDEYLRYAKVPMPKASQIKTPVEQSKAPYFTSWLRQQLVDKYGAGEAFGGGLQVTSTLDLGLQNQLQRITDQRAGGVGLNSAAVVLDNVTGGVRAMVGGTDYQNEPFNLATQGHRQPGSSFKPFTLVTALEQGHSPDQTFNSAPQNIPFRAKVTKKNGATKVVPEVFPVHNYGDEYMGTASIATATTYSDNSVYSQLGAEVGPANVAQTAYRMGIQTSLATPGVDYSIGGNPFAPYNPALILGGLRTGVSPLEMAHAYLTLAHNGQLVSGSMADSPGEPIGIQKVQDTNGNLVQTNDGSPGQDKIETKQVVAPDVAATARTLLHSVVTSGTGRNADTGDPNEWGKTGTTENNGDAWFVGSNQQITVAIWVGHADSVKPMLTEYGGSPVDGGTIPALIFSDVVGAYEAEKAQSTAAKKSSGSSTSTTPTTLVPAPTTTTAAPAAPAPVPQTAAPAQPSQQQAPQQAPAPSTPPSSGGGAPSGGSSGNGGVSG